VTRRFPRWAPMIGALLLAACGGSDPNPPSPVDCSAVSPTSLAAGQYTILDASQTACVRIPGAGTQEAEYLYVALASEGTETTSGISASYKLQGGPSPSASVAALSPAVFDQPPTAAQAFHDRLRARERDLSRQPAAAEARRRISASVAPVPPVVGSQRTFDVCATTACDSFVQSTAKAKVVGQLRHLPAPGPGSNQPSSSPTQKPLLLCGERLPRVVLPVSFCRMSCRLMSCRSCQPRRMSCRLI